VAFKVWILVASALIRSTRSNP